MTSGPMDGTDQKTESGQESDPGSGAPAAAPVGQSPRRSDRLRLVLAFLTGSLLTAAVFLVILLVRSGPQQPKRVAVAAAVADVGEPADEPDQPKGGVLKVPDVDGRDTRPPRTKRALPPPGPAPRPRQPRDLFGRPGANPFAQIDQMMRRMQKQMRQRLGNLGGGFTLRLGGDDTDIDVREEPDAVIVIARVKDAVAGKFDIRVNGREFTLRGQRSIGSGAFRGHVSFSQSVSLPADVDPTGMTSKFEKGVLRVRLPKKR